MRDILAVRIWPESSKEALRKREGAGKAGGASAPQPRVVVENTRVSHHRFAGHSRPSLRDGFTAYFVISPVIGLSCHRREPQCGSIAANLTSASRCQDHTTSPSATRALVSRAHRVHRNPRLTFVTIASVPLIGRGAAGLVDLICPTAQVKGLRPVGATGKSIEQRGILSSEKQLRAPWNSQRRHCI
jgi:hypothetical protein